MRPHLFDPTKGDVRLSEAIAIGREIYGLFEAGQDYTGLLNRLGLIAGRTIDPFEVDTAFGSVDPETFARTYLIDWDNLPTDLTRGEMIEMLDGISGDIEVDEFQVDYWLQCLRVNTGDSKISDLIFWPGAYFGDGDDGREMSSSDILTTALRAGGKAGPSEG